jgi:thymidine kinase
MNTKQHNMSSFTSSGYLELIIGPMYSGKTSKLLEIYKQCKFCEISVSIINHSLDKRYHDTMLSSHDKVMVPCINTDNLHNLWFNNGMIDLHQLTENSDYKKVRNSDVLLINEGQFFPDLYNVVYDMLKNKKTVYVCGLDGDFERKKFGQILDLVPICDNIMKLSSLCSNCKNGTPGIFSMRITNDKQQTVIGSENYLPVCRFCYEKKL